MAFEVSIRSRKQAIAVSALMYAVASGLSAVCLLNPVDAAKLIASMPTNAIKLEPASFSDLPGWSDDDHLAAWKAFLVSCGPVLKASRHDPTSLAVPPHSPLMDACNMARATAQSGVKQTRRGARQFFETFFRPHRVADIKVAGLLTGYYEPLIKGSRTPGPNFAVPVYRRPPDLVNVVAESERGAKSGSYTHMRKTEHGLEPYLTRAEIDQGGLTGKGLELIYLKDPVDLFFMQVQGSGRIELPSGEKVRIAYDGKNGYPYTSIGRVLIDSGLMKPDAMSLQALKRWLQADPERARKIMWKNQSYVFFRELTGNDAKAPIGVDGIPLQPGRSLAIDTSFYAIGTPIFVDSNELALKSGSNGFHRLMIAHDVGSAIKGPERGDIYFGSGDEAGRLAGTTKHAGRFFVLLPEAHAIQSALARLPS